MVAQPNTEPINWDELDALAVKHLDTTLDLLLGRVGIKSREDFARLAKHDHTEAMKYLGSAIALWRLTVRVYVAETRQARNGGPYLSLDYGFARVSIFAKTVNAIFRGTAHLINDWRTPGYQYGFRPYINVRLSVDRNGYPVVDQLKDPEIMSDDQPTPEIHENLRAYITKRYASMAMDDWKKMLYEYARTLHFFYDHAAKQDDTNGWIAPPLIPGMMIHNFHQITYVELSGFLVNRWVKIDATTNEKQYRITKAGCEIIGRAYPLQLDELPPLPEANDQAEPVAAGDETEPVEQPEPVAADIETLLNDYLGDDLDTDTDQDETEADDDTPISVPVEDFIRTGDRRPRIEVKTLMQSLGDATAAADRELADHLNDRWSIIDITVTSKSRGDDGAWQHKRVVTLRRSASRPAGDDHASARAAAYIPPQATPVGHGIRIQAPANRQEALNTLVDELPIASAMRRGGWAAVRQQMNDAALAAGQSAFDKSMQTYPRRQSPFLGTGL